MYLDGRSHKNPADGWYQGELGFFDFYIIPLAKKLETCGVFGVSSTEYLGYAEENRAEWAKKGENLVKVYLERFKLRKESWSFGVETDADLIVPEAALPESSSATFEI